MDAKVTDDLRTWATASVKSTLRKNLEGPDQHFKHYSEVLRNGIVFCTLHCLTSMLVPYRAVTNYDWLVNGTAKAQLKQFVEEDRSFDEYIKVKRGRSRYDQKTLQK